MSTSSLSRRTAMTAGLALGVALTTATSAVARPATKTPATDATGITGLQWSAVTLTAEQYPAMKVFTEKALGLTLVSGSENWAEYSAPNGSRFALHGPKAPRALRGPGAVSVAVGFDASNLGSAQGVLERSGAGWVSPVQVRRGEGEDGTDLRFRFFRGPDNRIYRIAQTNVDPSRPVPESAAGPAGIQKLDFAAVTLTAEQFPTMREFIARVLGPRTYMDETDFTIFLAENGSRFELYGPTAPQLPWRTDPTSMGMGFKALDLDRAMAHLEQNGAEWVTPVFEYDNRFRFFRAPDNRIYSISETAAA